MSSNELKGAQSSTNAFEIDERVCVKIDFCLAVSLGNLILSTDIKNPALLALGHRLRSLDNVET